MFDLNLVLLNHHEPDDEEGFKAVNDFIIKNKINSNQIWIINNNRKLKKKWVNITPSIFKCVIYNEVKTT